MSENESRSRITYEQLKSLIDFMGQHIDLASGNLRTLEARHESKKLWKELTKLMNSCQGGMRKTADGWSKYWSDFKNKLKSKVKIFIKKNKLNPSLISTNMKSMRPLTKLEKRALLILQPFFEKDVLPVHTKTLSLRKKKKKLNSNLTSKVKIEEVSNEMCTDNVLGEFCKTQSETSDRLSDGNRETEESAYSDDEWTDEDTTNETVVQNLYPKWLIEVEKKRADAELIRARAEEERVKVAAKNAEAALIQAEALKKLSEAATIQADAIMRIAAALENRGHSEEISVLSI